MDDETIHFILRRGGSLKDRVEELVRVANQNGGKDNISVIVIELPSEQSKTISSACNSRLKKSAST